MRYSPWGTLGGFGAWAAVVSGVVLFVVFMCPADAQTDSTATTLTLTNQSRPVMQAVIYLMSKYGYAISYEDPRYVYQGDLKDVTQEHRHVDKFPPGKAPQVFIPLGGNLELSMPRQAQVNEQTMGDLLHQLVQSWFDGNRGGGHFQVEQQGEMFHILPAEVRDLNGNWRPAGSVLSGPITLATVPREDSETYKAVGRAIGAAAGVKVVTLVNGGLILGGAVPSKEYVFGAQNEAADSVLMRAFKMMGMKRTWFLTYEPTTQTYYLNIDDVSGFSAATPALPSRPSPARAPSGAPRRTS